MAARKKTSKVESTVRKARATAAKAPAHLIENVQQIWLAGMGAIARAQKEGPAAFQEAVADGFMQIALLKGRSKKKVLKVGICGEHGGDPSSVEFCHMNNFDYVSCSPFRVPIARLAAAQAEIKRPWPKTNHKVKVKLI